MNTQAKKQTSGTSVKNPSQSKDFKMEKTF